MKVIGNNVLYVQAKDIKFLTLTSNKNIPFSILDKYDDNLDGNEFIKYTNKKDIRFLNKLNWLICFNELINLPDNYLLNYSKNIAYEQALVAKIYNNMNEEKRKGNTSLVLKSEELKYKALSIREVLWIKDGFIKLKLNKKDVKRNTKTRRFVKRKSAF